MPYPIDQSPLPRLTHGMPRVWYGEYERFGDRVSGWLVHPNSNGEKQIYMFETHWINGKAHARISLGDPSKGIGFWSRGWNNELKGVPSNHLKSQKRFAMAIGEHIRNNYLSAQDFLMFRSKNGAVEVAQETWEEYGKTTTLFLDGSWLIEQVSGEFASGPTYSALHVGEDNAELVREKIKELADLYASYRAPNDQ